MRPCEDSVDYTEDSCLLRCLVTKFVDEYKCIHPRLVGIDGSNLSAKVCGYSDLKDHAAGTDDGTDPGLVRIRQIYHAFDESSDIKVKKKLLCLVRCDLYNSGLFFNFCSLTGAVARDLAGRQGTN